MKDMLLMLGTLRLCTLLLALMPMWGYAPEAYAQNVRDAQGERYQRQVEKAQETWKAGKAREKREVRRIRRASSSPRVLIDFTEEYRRISEEIERRLLREDVNPSPLLSPATSAGSSGASGGAGGAGNSGGDSGGQDGQQGGQSDGQNQKYGQGSEYGYDSPATVPGTVNVPSVPRPAGIGAGHDEDIVAKQIREAAETESDPEIRKKLWDEYKKYKAAQ